MIIDIIKTWEFNRSERSHTTFYNGVRLNSEIAHDSRIQLTANPRYPTSDDNYIKTRKTSPKRVTKWKMFEPIWKTTESSFREYSMIIDNKSGSTFSYLSKNHMPRIGDRIYQGDYNTTVLSISGNNITLTDGSQFVNGRVLVIRSVCDILYRIYDEDDTEWFFNVSTQAWENPTSNDDWSTSYVINNHIADLELKTFNQTIGFLANLRTTDTKHTPLLYSIQLLGTFDIEFTEDMIFDSIIPYLEEGMVATTQVNIRLSSDTDTIDLANEYVINTGYNITGIELAYNVTDDPNRTENIAQSYTVGLPKEGYGNFPGQVHLNAVQTAGSVIELKMRFFPEIAVNTSREYYEVTKTPMIVFEHIEKKSRTVSSKAILGRNFIRNKLTLTGVLESSPEQYDLIIEYAVFTDNQTDQYRIGEAIHRFFNSLNEISSWGLDEPYVPISDDIFKGENSPNVADINTHVGRFRIVNFIEFIREPENVYLVDYLQNTITTN